jgi:hypothetical protein
MHFAAFAYVGESVSDPELYYQNNLGGTLALLGAMRAAGRSRSTGPIIRRRTAPRSAITSMSAIWPMPISARSAISPPAATAQRSTWGPDKVLRCAR